MQKGAKRYGSRKSGQRIYLTVFPGKEYTRVHRFYRNEIQEECSMTVTFKGNPITLCGKQLQPGDSMPDFTLTDNKLQLVRGKDLSGVRVFLTIPSLSLIHI